MARLPAALTFAEAAQALGALQSALAQVAAGARYEIDAADLAACDTSAIAVLLQLRREAQQRGLAFAVRNPPAKLRQLAALYGVEELLLLDPAAAAA